MYHSLVDNYNRKINSVRISVIDRCNFRCKYCMPDGLINWTDKENLLSYEELNHLVGILYKCGVNKIRLTGGEPTIRSQIEDFCAMLTQNYPNIELSMTTNGYSLLKIAEKLKKSGVSRLNISFDTFNEELFNKVTRREYFDEVLRGIYYAHELGFIIKLNAVSIKSFNDDMESIKNFIEFSEKTGIEIRFIELMPFTGNEWSAKRFLSSAELREIICKYTDISEIEKSHESQTSRVFRTKNGGKIGFISSVSETFCQYCDRIRITADGNLRPCLHENKEYPLRDLIRSGSSDEEILKIIRGGINDKWKEHPDFLALKYLPPLDDREMIRIGG